MSDEKFSSPPPSLPMPMTTSCWELARRRARLAVARNERAARVLMRGLDRGVGKRRKLGERFFEAGQAGEVAPRDAHHLALAPGTKRSDELRVGDGRGGGLPPCGARA